MSHNYNRYAQKMAELKSERAIIEYSFGWRPPAERKGSTTEGAWASAESS